MAPLPKLNDGIIEQISNLIGDTQTGLTGTKIGKVLARVGIDDLEPTITKRTRLFKALKGKQERDGCSNNVLAFVQEVMTPVHFVSNPDLFEFWREHLNEILAFAGYRLKKSGEMETVNQVDNLDEAQQRSNRLRAELSKRKVHHQVMRYCGSELLQENYFHAVFESVKGIADSIREKTGLSEDGASLVDLAFNIDQPYIALNTLRTETEKSEQRGFINLLKGTFGMFRNVTAHAPKIKWPISEEDAFDLLTLVSLIHKKLDQAAVVKTVTN